MLKAYPFGAWMPDVPPVGLLDEQGLGLVTAQNVFASPNGYRPVGEFQAITPALAADFRGGAAFVGSDGTAALLSATLDDLYTYSSGAWASVLTVASTGRWRFTQFGDNIIAVHGGAPVKYEMLAGTAGSLGGSPPTAELVTTVRDFVVLGKTGGDILSVRWSGFNDSEGWTNDTNQAGEQQMLDGGEVMGLAGGEYGLVIQRDAIRRMTYIGGELVWQFDVIAPNVGCMAEGSVAQVGRLVFFLSERGFMLCDGNETRQIGAEVVDRTFFSRYSRADIENIYAAVDPRNTLVMWSMPGSPGAIWAYNWVLNRWATIETGLVGIFTGFTANTSIDGLDALYPSGIDSIDMSLDDPSFAGGNPLFLVANASSEVGTLSGDNLAALIETSWTEPAPGRRVRMRSARPVTDSTAISLVLDARTRLGDDENHVAASSMRANGEMPTRANGRYLMAEMTIPAGEAWSFVRGIEFAFEPGSRL